MGSNKGATSVGSSTGGYLLGSLSAGVRAIAMDMWLAYMSAANALLAKQSESPLTGTKYQWLKCVPDKRCAEALAFRHLYQTNLSTARAWSLKESFVPFWDYRYVKSAASYFDAWSTRAMRSRIEQIKKVASMLRRHREGLLNDTKRRITSAVAEGFNSIIQTIEANARGFRSFENFRVRILFFCGKLDLHPANVRFH